MSPSYFHEQVQIFNDFQWWSLWFESVVLVKNFQVILESVSSCWGNRFSSTLAHSNAQGQIGASQNLRTISTVHAPTAICLIWFNPLHILKSEDDIGVETYTHARCTWRIFNMFLIHMILRVFSTTILLCRMYEHPQLFPLFFSFLSWKQRIKAQIHKTKWKSPRLSTNPRFHEWSISAVHHIVPLLASRVTLFLALLRLSNCKIGLLCIFHAYNMTLQPRHHHRGGHLTSLTSQANDDSVTMYLLGCVRR